MSRLSLYISTAIHLKPSQIFYRIWRRLGGKARLRIFHHVCPNVEQADIARIPTLPELDFDPSFLGRFDVRGIVRDRIRLLNHEESVDWTSCWSRDLSTPLWRFNLHYHEYLLPLGKAYFDTGDICYVDKAKAIIDGWINACPLEKGGVAWDPYVISLRTVNWLSFYGELVDELSNDNDFIARLNNSLAEQFAYLSKHLEKDLLANHYLENLKALVLLSVYFNDAATLKFSLLKLNNELREQVLPDGMHFELSPMYHKIILEDVLRVFATLRHNELDFRSLSYSHVQIMCNCLYSLERGISRTPLFNDSGDNVSKSRDALLSCAKRLFGITPHYNNVLPNSGYAILERNTKQGKVKLLFDTGSPGPEYAMGHAHCDALSFECFLEGEPWMVNSGTCMYQGGDRLRYKSVSAHNSMQVSTFEHMQCWSSFRVAKRYKQIDWVVSVDEKGNPFAEAEIEDYSKHRLRRRVVLADEGIHLIDSSDNGQLIRYFHFVDGYGGDGEPSPYCPEFGRIESARRVVCDGDKAILIGYGEANYAELHDSL